MVTAGMLLLAVIGVLAVFHGPIAAVLFPPAPDGELSGAGAERPLSAQQR